MRSHLDVPSTYETEKRPSNNEVFMDHVRDHSDEVTTPPPSSDQSRRNTSLVQVISDNLLGMPVMLLVALLRILYTIVVKLIGDPLGGVRDFFMLGQEENKTLRDVPKQQQKQRRDLNTVQARQELQRQRVEDLRHRIERMDQRRHGQSPPSPTKPYKKHHY